MRTTPEKPVEAAIWSIDASRPSTSGVEVRSAGRGHLPARLPLRPRFGRRRVEVGLDAREERAEVRPELVVGGAAPEPVAHVDLLDDQAGREDQRVRDA